MELTGYNLTFIELLLLLAVFWLGSGTLILVLMRRRATVESQSCRDHHARRYRRE